MAERIQQDLAFLIQREVRDPRVGFITITEVGVSKDLSFADVYISVLGKNSKEEASDTLKGLQSAAGFLRGLLRKDLNTKVTPRLRFHFDEAFMRGQSIHQLLTQISMPESLSSEADSSAEVSPDQKSEQP